MLVSLVRNWWILLLNGLCAIAFSVIAFAWPSAVLWTLVILFGAYCLADGVTSIMVSFTKDDQGRNWGVMLIGGLLSVGAGLITIFWPGLTSYLLLMLIAGWSIVKGIFEIVAAVHLRKFIKHEWMLISAGAVSILFGIVMIANPAESALAIVWLIALVALGRGVLLVILSLRLRGLNQTVQAVIQKRDSRSDLH